MKLTVISERANERAQLCSCSIIDTIDYVQGIGNGPINPLHPCPKPNTFST